MKKLFILLFIMHSLLLISCNETLINEVNVTNEVVMNNKMNAIGATKDEETNVPISHGKSQFDGYNLIVVDGGNLSGKRKKNVVVDIGFGYREYFAFTNEYGQLEKVIASEIILQDETSEKVTSEGRYYPDEAKVSGVESSTLDEGHV